MKQFRIRMKNARLAYALLVPLLLVVYVAGLFVLPTAEMRALIDKITG